MKDQLLGNMNMLEIMIRAESSRQVEKWGVQDRSPFEWLTYIIEEVGELADAILACEYQGEDPQQVVTEAVQAATLCLKVAEMHIPPHETTPDKEAAA